MSKVTVALLVLVLAALAGGIHFLSRWDIPAPSVRVEKVIPDERLPR